MNCNLIWIQADDAQWMVQCDAYLTVCEVYQWTVHGDKMPTAQTDKTLPRKAPDMLQRPTLAHTDVTYDNTRLES